LSQSPMSLVLDYPTLN